MPELPSGKKVALANANIRDMVERPMANLKELGAICIPEHLYQYIYIIEFVKPDNSDSFDKATFIKESKRLNEIVSLKPVLKDYSILDVFKGAADWSEVDINAFSEWLLSDDIRAVHQADLNSILDQKKQLKGTVEALAFMDIDPDQDEREQFRRASEYIKAILNISMRKG